MTNLKKIVTLLHAYHQTKRLTTKFQSRAELERHQQSQLNTFIKQTLSRSPYFQPLLDKPFEQWKYMDKSIMMGEFDRINTLGIHKDEAWQKAHQAERGDIQSATIPTAQGEITVGLSSGTSGQRGMFLVSQTEQARWAGVMLAKMLPDGLMAKERVALLLRANSNLYQAVKTPLLTLEYFDLFTPIEQWQQQLARYNPSILVAPAQVLVYLAQQVKQNKLILTPTQVISGAEVLSHGDKALLQSVFQQAQIKEVYQATEGFLASTCSHGHLHLNEAHILIEKEWLEEGKRFSPIVTDFSRHTQPIVRYRMNDILHIDPLYVDNICPCGDVSTVIKRIEGRTGDTLILTSRRAGQTVAVFADVLERAISRCLVGRYASLDYELVQQAGSNTLTLTIANADALKLVSAEILQTLQTLTVDIEQIRLHQQVAEPNHSFILKKRRVRVVNPD